MFLTVADKESLHVLYFVFFLDQLIERGTHVKEHCRLFSTTAWWGYASDTSVIHDSRPSQVDAN